MGVQVRVLFETNRSKAPDITLPILFPSLNGPHGLMQQIPEQQQKYVRMYEIIMDIAPTSLCLGPPPGCDDTSERWIYNTGTQIIGRAPDYDHLVAGITRALSNIEQAHRDLYRHGPRPEVC